MGTPPAGLTPALSLYTQIIYLRDVGADRPIGYGGSYRTRRATRIATLPVGYHDGYLHHFSQDGEVLMRGQRAPVVGRICMDYTMVDVSRIPGAAVGDRVTLLGRDGCEALTAGDLSRWAGTIPYEIPSLLGNRVRRFYHHGEEPGARRERRIVWENSRWRFAGGDVFRNGPAPVHCFGKSSAP